MNYREYQRKIMRECITDALLVIDSTTLPNYKWDDVGGDLAPNVMTVAVAMFALRCKHAHYYEEDVKKEFKDKGMTTDELALSAKGCECDGCNCGGHQ